MLVVERLDELVDIMSMLDSAYVRFSAGPEQDAGRPSTDGESGALLPGLSVNRLRPEPWWDRPVRVWVARQVCQYAHLADAQRYPWVLTGTEVGRGPDSEPLVAEVTAVARLGAHLMNEALEVYRREMAPGRTP